jgi:hypothetical protein
MSNSFLMVREIFSKFSCAMSSCRSVSDIWVLVQKHCLKEIEGQRQDEHQLQKKTKNQCADP